MVHLVGFLLFICIGLCLGQTEQFLVDQANRGLARFDSTVVWQYVTNRPENVTHGNVTFVPNPEVPDFHRKATYFANVDVFSRLQVNASMFNIVVSNRSFENIVTYLEIPGPNNTLIRSTRKTYFQNNFVVGSWSAYISIDEGTNVGIYWDGGCQECSNPDQCVDNFCALSVDNCVKNILDAVCEMKIYLAWLGTGVPQGSAAPCTSAGFLPSTFRLMALSPAFEQAAGIPSGTAGLFF